MSPVAAVLFLVWFGVAALSGAVQWFRRKGFWAGAAYGWVGFGGLLFLIAVVAAALEY